MWGGEIVMRNLVRAPLLPSKDLKKKKKKKKKTETQQLCHRTRRTYYGAGYVPANSGIGTYFDIRDRMAGFKDRSRV